MQQNTVGVDLACHLMCATSASSEAEHTVCKHALHNQGVEPGGMSMITAIDGTGQKSFREKKTCQLLGAPAAASLRHRQTAPSNYTTARASLTAGRHTQAATALTHAR
jgi:hypothetical protein